VTTCIYLKAGNIFGSACMLREVEYC